MVKKKSSNRRVIVRKKTNDTVTVKRIIIGVIIAAIGAVIVGLMVGFFCNSERMTKMKLDEMAREYYEEYIYEDLINGAMSQADIDGVMKRYEKWGFAPVALRQLLLYDNRKNMEHGGFVKQYCDENDTSVKFYPEQPYGKKSYRIEYNYKCEW